MYTYTLLLSFMNDENSMKISINLGERNLQKRLELH